MDYTSKPLNSTFNDQTQQDQNFGQTSFNQTATPRPDTTGGAMGLSYGKPNNPTYRNIMEQKAPVAMNPTTGMDWKDALNYATGQLSNKSWVNLGRGSRKGQAAAGELGTILNTSVNGFNTQQQAQSDFSIADQKNRTLFGMWQNAAQAGLNRINTKKEVVKDRFNLGMGFLNEKRRHNRMTEGLAWALVTQGKLPNNWQAILFPQKSNSGITMLPKFRGNQQQPVSQQNSYGRPQGQPQSRKEAFMQRLARGEATLQDAVEAWKEGQATPEQPDPFAQSRAAIQKMLSNGPLFR